MRVNLTSQAENDLLRLEAFLMTFKSEMTLNYAIAQDTVRALKQTFSASKSRDWLRRAEIYENMEDNLKQDLRDFIRGKPRALLIKEAQDIILNMEAEIDPFYEMRDDVVVTIVRSRIKAFFNSGEIEQLLDEL